MDHGTEGFKRGPHSGHNYAERRKNFGRRWTELFSGAFVSRNEIIPAPIYEHDFLLVNIGGNCSQLQSYCSHLFLHINSRCIQRQAWSLSWRSHLFGWFWSNLTLSFTIYRDRHDLDVEDHFYLGDFDLIQL